jgi:hypothetical protein
MILCLRSFGGTFDLHKQKLFMLGHYENVRHGQETREMQLVQTTELCEADLCWFL